MGMLLDDPNGVADLDMRSYWENQLKNDKVLLNEVDRAIMFFLSPDGANGTVEYTIDTGQDRQTVKRSELVSLYSWKQRLVAEINQLSNALYGGSRWSQVLPGY